jgi:hypothetical protein
MLWAKQHGTSEGIVPIRRKRPGRAPLRLISATSPACQSELSACGDQRPVHGARAGDLGESLKKVLDQIFPIFAPW